MIDLESRIITRLYQTLSSHIPCTLHPSCISIASLPDTRITIVEDRDDMHHWIVSRLEDGGIHVEHFALDEFDRLLSHVTELNRHDHH